MASGFALLLLELLKQPLGLRPLYPDSETAMIIEPQEYHVRRVRKRENAQQCNTEDEPHSVASTLYKARQEPRSGGPTETSVGTGQSSFRVWPWLISHERLRRGFQPDSNRPVGHGAQRELNG